MTVVISGDIGVSLASNLSGGSAGTVPYQSASGTTAMLAAGTSGQVLLSNGAAAPSWGSAGVTSLNGQTGAITDTSLYAIGSYVTGRPQNNTEYSVDSTIAGSILYSAPQSIYWSGTNTVWNQVGVTSATNNNNATAIVNVGTWRCVSPARSSSSSATVSYCGLWVRIS